MSEEKWSTPFGSLTNAEMAQRMSDANRRLGSFTDHILDREPAADFNPATADEALNSVVGPLVEEYEQRQTIEEPPTDLSVLNSAATFVAPVSLDRLKHFPALMPKDELADPEQTWEYSVDDDEPTEEQRAEYEQLAQPGGDATMEGQIWDALGQEGLEADGFIEAENAWIDGDDGDE